MNPLHFGIDPADYENPDSNSGSLLLEILALSEVCAL